MSEARWPALRRLRAAMKADARLQQRNGFYAAAAFVAVCMIPLLRRVSPDGLILLLPPLVLLNMQVNTFYFMGGLVLLEKAEGSLQALTVTPLRPAEYLTSKVATLALLSLVEAAVIVLATHGPSVNWPALAMGIGLTSILLCLYGFIAVARYDTVNAFLFPSMVYTAVVGLPVLDYFGVWAGPLWYAHPVRAPLILLEAAFHPVAAWQLAYALGYGLLWSVGLGVIALREFDRHVLRRRGDG